MHCTPTQYRVLIAIHRKRHITALITGTPPGAEEIAYYLVWHPGRNSPKSLHPPAPTITNKADYGLRNLNALRDLEPNGVVAFPGTGPAGGVIDLAVRFRIPIWEVNRTGDNQPES